MRLQKAHEEHDTSRQRLLRTHRLSLVLDLDQTLLECTDDPRVAMAFEHKPPFQPATQARRTAPRTRNPATPTTPNSLSPSNWPSQVAGWPDVDVSTGFIVPDIHRFALSSKTQAPIHYVKLRYVMRICICDVDHLIPCQCGVVVWCGGVVYQLKSIAAYINQTDHIYVSSWRRCPSCTSCISTRMAPKNMPMSLPRLLIRATFTFTSESCLEMKKTVW
jgi:hypothetical protein